MRSDVATTKLWFTEDTETAVITSEQLSLISLSCD